MPELITIKRVILGRGEGKNRERIDIAAGKRFDFSQEEANHLTTRGMVRDARELDRERKEAERAGDAGVLTGVATRDDGGSNVTRGNPADDAPDAPL